MTIATSTAGPLDGLRVVEIASWMAGPSAAAILADMGADVIKIEPLTGDPMRGLIRPAKQPGPHQVDHAFQVDNRGKRSMAIDLGSDEGQAIVRRVVATADIFVVNLLPHRQARFGLDAASVDAIRPGIVHATLTGYGLDGPETWRPGYDVTAFFGRSGLYDAQREGDGPPPQARTAQGDHTTGMAMTTAILGALRLAERTGDTQVVDVSLFATAIWTQASDLAAVLVDGRQPSRRDRHHLISALANRFPCKDDGWVVFNMPEPHWWPRFCGAVERADWLDDPRFASVKTRFDHMEAVIQAIDEVLGQRTVAEWAPRFDEAGLIWGPVQTYAEVAMDAQAIAIGCFPVVEHPHGDFRTVAIPINIAGADVGPHGRAPEIGEHTSELMTELGYDAADIDRLTLDGVITHNKLASSN